MTKTTDFNGLIGCPKIRRVQNLRGGQKLKGAEISQLLLFAKIEGTQNLMEVKNKLINENY